MWSFIQTETFAKFWHSLEVCIYFDFSPFPFNGSSTKTHLIQYNNDTAPKMVLVITPLKGKSMRALKRALKWGIANQSKLILLIIILMTFLRTLWCLGPLQSISPNSTLNNKKILHQKASVPCTLIYADSCGLPHLPSGNTWACGNPLWVMHAILTTLCTYLSLENWIRSDHASSADHSGKNKEADSYSNTLTIMNYRNEKQKHLES